MFVLVTLHGRASTSISTSRKQFSLRQANGKQMEQLHHEGDLTGFYLVSSFLWTFVFMKSICLVLGWCHVGPV